MSAVTSHVESRAEIDQTPLVCPAASLGARHPSDQICVPEPTSSHAKLLTFAWGRQLAEELIAGHSFHRVAFVENNEANIGNHIRILTDCEIELLWCRNDDVRRSQCVYICCSDAARAVH